MNISLTFKEQEADFNLTRDYFQTTNNNLLTLELCNQGILWNNLPNNREKLRNYRLKYHKGHRNTQESIADKRDRSNFFMKTGTDIFYQFSGMFTKIPITVQHFQLRKNMKFLNKSEIVYVRTFGIEKLNLVTFKRQFLVLFSCEESIDYGRISCFDSIEMSDNILIICGKMDGNVALYTIKKVDLNLKTSMTPPSEVIRARLADDGEFQIINKIKFLEDGSKVMVGCNDSHTKIFEIESGNFKLIKLFKATSAVNDCTFNSSENILAAVGDFESVELFDFKTTEKIGVLKGHLDFGFSATFKPQNDYYLATGNQDYRCKLWDLRKMTSEESIFSFDYCCIHTLFGNFDSIGEIKFIDNELICYSENTDFLHIYDCKNDNIQSLQYFGSSAGLAIQPFSKKIYLSVNESSHFGILSYDKIRGNLTNLENISI